MAPSENRTRFSDAWFQFLRSRKEPFPPDLGPWLQAGNQLSEESVEILVAGVDWSILDEWLEPDGVLNDQAWIYLISMWNVEDRERVAALGDQIPVATRQRKPVGPKTRFLGGVDA